jgi:subtilisin family serine protease
MLRRLVFIGFLVCIASLFGATFTAAQPAKDEAAAPGEYLIGYAPDMSENEREAAITAAGGRLVRHLPELFADLVAFPTAQVTAGSPAETQLMGELSAEAGISYVEPNYSYSLTATYRPDDALLTQQYALTQVNAFDSWAVTRGSAGVVIAIVDTGVQLDHPDLRSKLVAGYDFVDEDTVPSDGFGHGTHVAGIAAAATNNSVGIAGACPICRLMPVRVIGSNGTGFAADIAQGIVFATDQGARVINLSLGGSASNVLKNAVDYARSKGAFLACAAGNGGTSITPSYPAAYDACFAVAATTSTDARASFSNYGSWVEVAAPGDRILSTYTQGTYRQLSGTSMAAPLVAGLAGLLSGRGYTADAIRERICATADSIAATGTNWTCGRVNFVRALTDNAPADAPMQAYLPLVR